MELSESGNFINNRDERGGRVGGDFAASRERGSKRSKHQRKDGSPILK